MSMHTVLGTGLLASVMVLGPLSVSAQQRVFVSSTSQNGNLGGLAGGDALCQGLADAESLGGTWIAWLSDSNTDAADRLRGNGPFVKAVGGAQIAADRAQLLSASLDNDIDDDENGFFVDDEDVWTGTDSSGQSSGFDCLGWTSDSSGQQVGDVGETDQSDGKWTESTNRGCATSQHVYCFEQGAALTTAPALTGRVLLAAVVALFLVGWVGVTRRREAA